MKYDVNEHQCNVVSNNVATDMADYQTANTAMDKATKQAAADAKSEIVGAAINGYLSEAYNTDVASISTLTNNARKGLADALAYIRAGDEEMADTSLAALANTDGAGSDVPKGAPAQSPAAKGS